MPFWLKGGWLGQDRFAINALLVERGLVGTEEWKKDNMIVRHNNSVWNCCKV